MARIFTTQFTFNHQNYDAIVTAISKDGITSFKVKVLDLELHDILPDGVFSYSGAEDFEHDEVYGNRLNFALKRSISVAIQEHLSTIE